MQYVWQITILPIAGNFRGVKNSFNSKTVIFVSKKFCFEFIACVPVSHAYVFVEVSLPTKITNILPHENDMHAIRYVHTIFT